jgi:rubrerythrin
MPNTIDVVNFSPRALTFSSGVTTTQTSDGTVSADSVTPAARKNLQEHLQAAVSLELQTIPLYLYAAYSIKKPGPASWSIINVVKQEMLHLALSGNILRSIGADPILYHPKTDNHSFVPEYPDEMLYQDITLNLQSANKRTLRTFLELERPEPELNLVDEASLDNSKYMRA